MRKAFAAAVICSALMMTSCHRVSETPAKTPGITDAPYGYSSSGEFISPVYAALSDEEQAVYDKVRDSAANFREEVYFDPPVSRESLLKIYRLVYLQERRYFWLSNLFYTPDSEVFMLRLNYLYEKEDAEIKRAELDLAVSTIIGEIPVDADDFDKVVYFHDRIVTSCKFSSTGEHINSAYGVLVAGYGQCEGYAAALALLCDKAGIPNYLVFGANEDGETHAWNKVLLDGNWYNADCTWDDPIIERDDPDFVRHDYLLVKDSEIEGKTHFTDEFYNGLTVCDSDEMNYFAGKGLLFDTVSDGVEDISEQIKAAGSAGKREAEIRFSSDSAYYAAMARLFDVGEIKKIIEDINGKFGTRIRSAYKHNNDDMRIVHISLIYESDPEEEQS